MKIGYFLSSEEWGPKDLIDQAVKAQRAGFDGLWISDHYHPWNDAQGHSGFVWGTIGAIAQAAPGMHVTTAVTCPTMRIHPAVIAQAAATAAVLLDGNFTFGVGSGEALNEHIYGDAWPSADVRLEMLEESIEVIRQLWQGGVQSHRGRHYRVGDGFATVVADADAVSGFRSAGGEGKVVQGGVKVCWGADEAAALDHVTRLWPNDGLPGELAQILPTPAHFEQASTLVTEDLAVEGKPVGADVDTHVEAI